VFIRIALAMIPDIVTLSSFLQPHLLVFTVSQSSHELLILPRIRIDEKPIPAKALQLFCIMFSQWKCGENKNKEERYSLRSLC
jgi:hypothetical protein